jgi:5-methyltetrahydropteroyltriglutamate--homocysteine methyltransferase
MQKSTTRIRTSHVGRLPPSKGWEDMPARLANAEVIDSGEIASHVVPAIAETVKKQVEIGIDCINDGEFWTARSLAHYAAHFTGLEARPVKLGEPPTTRHSTRERDEFREFYEDMDKLGTLFFVPGEKPMPPMTERVIARGPMKSRGPQAINREIDAFRAAIDRSGSKVEEAFIAVLAPGWLDHFIFNEYYNTDEEFLFALAEAVREEYRAVVSAGFVLQIDDPGLPDWWDMIKPEPTVEEYRKFAKLRIEAVNHALVGIPEEKVRYHLCWGSWHGPHTHDLPLDQSSIWSSRLRRRPIPSRPATCDMSTNGEPGRRSRCLPARY